MLWNSTIPAYVCRARIAEDCRLLLFERRENYYVFPSEYGDTVSVGDDRYKTRVLLDNNKLSFCTFFIKLPRVYYWRMLVVVVWVQAMRTIWANVVKNYHQILRKSPVSKFVIEGQSVE